MPITKTDLHKITDYLWEIPKTYRNDMRVPARIYATEKLLEEILGDRSLEQLINVATLPGIQTAAYAMPDIHEGYGFPIGGVAATSYPDGIISPGGIGYDINCGVRLLKSELSFNDLKPYVEKLGRQLFSEIPAGVGRGGPLKLNKNELDEVLREGASWIVKKGYGEKEDLKHLESSGAMTNADPQSVSELAKKRGLDQVGTMGAGNHFVEVDRIDEIFDPQIAKVFGLSQDQIVILIHTGSRGLGHQVATDYIRLMVQAMSKYKITIPDNELAGAPLSSAEGTAYFAAMAAAANFAWANRQMIAFEIQTIWEQIFGRESKISTLYDVAHNIAKIEEHLIDGVKKKVIVHRKGATRAFPEQPVIIPGSMGTSSYVLVGTNEAMKNTFGSTCHGAGRRMSRHQAKKEITKKNLFDELSQKGIFVQAGSLADLPEEAPSAYKDIDEIIEIVTQAKIAEKVARLKPLIVIKG